MKAKEIIIHCSATPEGRDYTVADITRWHRQRGFRTIGYHYVIYRDGSVHQGRSENEMGAHCLGHNATSIGICYIGGLATDGRTPKDTRTPAQRAALVNLVAEMRRKYPGATVHGHNEFANSVRCRCMAIATSQQRPAPASMLILNFEFYGKDLLLVGFGGGMCGVCAHAVCAGAGGECQGQD